MKKHSNALVFFAVSKQIPIVYSADRGRAANIKMKQWNSHLLHRFKVITLAQFGCGCRGVDKGAAGAAFAAPIILVDATCRTNNRVFFFLFFFFFIFVLRPFNAY